MKFRVTRLVVATAAVLAVGAAPVAGVASAADGSGDAIAPLLRVGLAESMNTLDETKNIEASNVESLSLETLLKFGPEGQLEPGLATSWSQTSPVTYVYHLRQGIKFWDGDPLAATDVAYSLNYERAVGSQVAFAYSSVKSIEAIGPYTVVVNLTHPDASWRYTPAEPNSYIFEMKFAEEHKGTFGNPGVLLMGTGPWQVDSFDPTSGVELSANPTWWGGTVPFQQVAFSFFSNETTLALAFRSGEIDFVPEIISPQSFASTSGAKLFSTPSCDNTVFSMNTQSPGWDDVHVRRAVAYALDRTALQVANGGYATPIYTLTPPQMLLSIASQSQVNSLLNSLPLYPYSIAKAKAEMAQSAYPHGFSATLLAPIYGSEVNVDQVIAAELQKIGIDLQVKAVSVPAWLAVETGPAGKRLASLGEGGCFNPDPSAYNDLLGSWNTKPGGVNLADYAPPELDNLINAGLAASASDTRFSIYSKIFQALQTDEPYVGLFVRDFTIALSSKFTYPGFNYWSFNVLGIKPVA